MMNDVNAELLARYAPRPGRHALLPNLTPQQQVALLCRVLHREGYNDHIAGHITLRQDMEPSWPILGSSPGPS
jgi:hypothetical protein